MFLAVAHPRSKWISRHQGTELCGQYTSPLALTRGQSFQWPAIRGYEASLNGRLADFRCETIDYGKFRQLWGSVFWGESRAETVLLTL